MNANSTIESLENIAVELSQVANSEENYNLEWAYYLEQMSFSLQKQANDLRELRSILGISNEMNTLSA